MMTAPWSDLYPLPWDAVNRGLDWQVVAANGLTVVYVDVEWKARLFAAGPDLVTAGVEVQERLGTEYDRWEHGRLVFGRDKLAAAIAKALPVADFKKAEVYVCSGCHVPRTTVDERGKCKECRGRSA